MADDRSEAFVRLDVFLGEWVVEASFPGEQPAAAASPARTRFEWALDGRFLLQLTEISIPGVPDSLAIVGVDPETGGYTQHYFDSRGVARVYAMSLEAGVWTLTRESPDFTPLHFSQRYVGTFSEEGNAITGAWEQSRDDAGWEHDFNLSYRKAA
jgi:hypothetical protein